MIACICFQVTDEEIKNEILKGNKTLLDLKSVLFVSAGCGCCREHIEQLIKDING